MNNYFNRVIPMTQSIIESFYQKSFSYILPYLHPDILWVGAADNQLFCGYDMVTQQLEKLMGKPKCMIAKQNYHIIFQDAATCAVYGNYITCTSQDSYEMFSTLWHLTLIWRRSGPGPQVIHIHLSNPLALNGEEEPFPNTVGRHTYEYMQTLPKARLDPLTPLRFHGKNAETYYFKPEEILFVEAANINSILHTQTNSYSVCHPLNQLEISLPPQFIRVHRSFIVNRSFIQQLTRYRLYLKDGTVLPVPEKRYRNVRAALAAILNP